MPRSPGAQAPGAAPPRDRVTAPAAGKSAARAITRTDAAEERPLGAEDGTGRRTRRGERGKAGEAAGRDGPR
jgi:hypothetical protein